MPEKSKNASLSGHQYISAHMRLEGGKSEKIPFYRTIANCDHVSSICPLVSCAGGWSIDYRLHLAYTVGGKTLTSLLPTMVATVIKEEEWAATSSF